MPVRFLICAALAAFLVAGCAMPEKVGLHESLQGEAPKPLPRRVLLLPPDVQVLEMSAGGVIERVPVWSDEAAATAAKVLRAAAARRGSFELVDIPALAADKREQLEQHVALYDLVGGAALAFGRSNDPAWAHKKKAFDYTLGPGLAFLAEQTGTQAAVVVTGADLVSTGERKALFVVGLLLGVGIPLGASYVTMGVVDLETGSVLWATDDFQGGARDLRDPKDVAETLERMLTDFDAVRTGARK